MILDDIAKKYRTDKSSRGHGYMGVYEKYMAAYRERQVKLLEIGVCAKGNPMASLRTWKEYFPNGEIFGVDIVDCSGLFESRIRTFECDQKNREQLIELTASLTDFDFIIDDGDHTSEAQMISLVYLIDHLNYDGWYFIEDLHIKEGKATRDYIINSVYPNFLREDEIVFLEKSVLDKGMLSDKLAYIKRKKIC